ncbi:MAG: VOC family protein [Streptomycetaceae bacterium]|nr:VOC family protein [Streptomycetaceae bacterium]
MSVAFNHTIIAAPDNRESAEFLAHILGLEVGAEWGPFIPLSTGNGVALDFATVPVDKITTQHYAFLISDEEFDAALARLQAAGVAYYPEPNLRSPGEINHNHGGRGLYFLDPAGHGMEIITRPYGSH